jgi:hypothetical protein
LVRATRLPKRPSPLDWALIAAAAGAVLPIFVAATHRISDHWQPADDEAAIARLAHDVFTGHTPLLGMPSTIGNGVKLAGGGFPHHLGPMLFWLFAIPDRMTGSSPNALVVTIALLNIAVIAAVAWQVRRRAGSYAAIVAMLGISVMLWKFGRDLTVQIWNPYAALLPFLLFLVLAWSVASGDRVALPLSALVGSFVMQCHVLYVLPVVCVSVVAVVGFVLSDRAARTRADDAGEWRRGRRRALLATGLVVAFCWWTAAYDQMVHRPGNLTRLWRSLRGSQQAPLGMRDAFRYVARAVAIPPLFARRIPTASANGALVRPAGLWVALGAGAVVGLIVVLTIAARRRAPRDRVDADAQAAWLGVLALVAAALSVVVLARLPIELGGINIYRDRFVWIVGFYAWLALAVLVARDLASRSLGASVTSARSLAVVLLAVATIATGVVGARERSPAFAVATDESVAITQLTRQVRANATSRGPYLLQVGGTRAILTVGFGVMWDLVRHGYDVRVIAGDAYLGAAHGVPWLALMPRLLVVSSAGSFRPPAGAARVASFVADPSVPSRLASEEAAMVGRLDRKPPSLTAAGRTVLAGPGTNKVVDGLRSIAAAHDGSGSTAWRRMLDNHLLRLLVLGGLVALPARDAAALAHFDDLLDEAADAVLSVFVVPPPT